MSDAVRVEVKQVEIPTYVLGPESPYPALPWPEWHGHYPYAPQLDISVEKRPVKHRMVVLENEFVRVQVLPDLGGHLYSLFDKVAKQETFLVPPSVKYQNISQRGAWVAGGIEFNFGHRGHTVHTVNPVSWAVRQDVDGSGAVWIGGTIRPMESRWAVKISLQPERAAADVAILTAGPLALPGMMYWWSNSALEVTDQSKFYYFGTRAGGWWNHSWPICDGVDYRWYRNRIAGSDMFLMDPKTDYMGFFDFTRNHGMAQMADRFQAPGQKYFTWGADQRGRYWDLQLSDSEQAYCEIQRGRLATQGVTEPIPPLSVDGWTETWAPVNDTNGFSGFEGNLILSVNAVAGGAQVRVLSLVPQDHLHLHAFSGKQSLGVAALNDLMPSRPNACNFKLKKGQTCDRVVVTDHDGRTLMDWKEFVFPDADWQEHNKTFDPKCATVEELFLEGERLRFQSWPNVGDDALAMFDRVLKQDPGHSGTLKALAEIAYFNGQFDLTLAHINKAMERCPSDHALLLLLGWTQMQLGQPAAAADNFCLATRYEPGRRNGLIGLAAARIRLGEWAPADVAVDSLLAERPNDRHGRLFKTIILRHTNHKGSAADTLMGILEQDPLWAPATGEALLLGVPTHLAGDTRKLSDEAISAASLYVDLGLLADAAVILQVDETDEKFSPAIRLAMLAAVQHRLGDKAVKATLAELAKATTAGATPWATYSITLLTELTNAFPKQAMPHFLLGNVLASRRRTGEALDQWQTAIKLGMKDSIAYRNVGVAQWQLHQRDAALESYRLAWKLSNKDLHLFDEFDRILAEVGLHKERLRVYRSLSPTAQLRSMVALRRVPQLLDVEDYDTALKELAEREFFCGEGGEFVIRRGFLEALLGKAVILANAGKWAAAHEALKPGLTFPRNHNAGRREYDPEEAVMLYMLGLTAEAMGNHKEARDYWLRAASERHLEGELPQAYEMLAWLALGNLPRAMDMVHVLEDIGRGIRATSWRFRELYTPSMKKVIHGLAQLAKGRPHETRQLWQQGLTEEPFGRQLRPHLRMSEAVLLRMARKVTGKA